MEIKQLEIFLKICQLSSFTKAADELNYAQSNISFQIQKLEQELGCSLFDRIGHKIFLTKKGEKLVPYAKEILNLSRNAKNQLANNTSEKITISASESLCIYELPGFIQKFQTHFPQIEIFLTVSDHNNYADCLTMTNTDFIYLLDVPISDSTLITHYSNQLQTGLFVAPSHHLASKTSLSFPELMNERFILTKSECCYRQQFDKLMTSYPYQVALETSSLQAIKEMTLSGFGICLLPNIAVQKELHQKQLIQLPIDLNISIFSQLISHKDKWISPEEAYFIHILKSNLPHDIPY